eukprot:COSAG01_NODE_52730_length_344_cov_1.681633_2_plen_75_part_01
MMTLEEVRARCRAAGLPVCRRGKHMCLKEMQASWNAFRRNKPNRARQILNSPVLVSQRKRKRDPVPQHVQLLQQL